MPLWTPGLPLDGGTLLGPLIVPAIFVPGTGLITLGGDTELWRPAAGSLAIGQDTAANATLDLRGAASGTRSLGYWVAGAEKWRMYMAPASTGLFIRDMVNARQMVTYAPGADSDTALMTLLGSLTSDGILRLTRTGTSFTLQLTNTHATGQGLQVIIGASNYSLFAGKVNGDTQYRLIVDGTGKLFWGPGNAATDTDLWRSGVGTLSSTSILNLARNASGYTGLLTNPHATGYGWNVTLGAGANPVIRAQVTGDAGYRYILDANGTQWWGPGSGGYDTYLYRVAAGELRTDGAFTVQGLVSLIRNASSYSQLVTNPHATGYGTRYTLGAVGSVALGSMITGDTANRWYSTADGAMYWGPGGAAAVDTTLYRAAAGHLKTDTKFSAAQLSGALFSPVAAKTADYTLTNADEVILANAAITVTLPTPGSVGAGRRFEVKNIHASASAVFAAPGGYTIDGAASLTLAPKEAVTAISDGATWWAI